MSHTKPFPDPATFHALTDEADIGSGEKTPGQLDTEKMIRQIPALPAAGADLDQDATEDENEDDDKAAGREAAGAGRERREHDASLQRDEPADDLDGLDPVPPKGS